MLQRLKLYSVVKLGLAADIAHQGRSPLVDSTFHKWTFHSADRKAHARSAPRAARCRPRTPPASLKPIRSLEGRLWATGARSARKSPESTIPLSCGNLVLCVPGRVLPAVRPCACHGGVLCSRRSLAVVSVLVRGVVSGSPGPRAWPCRVSRRVSPICPRAVSGRVSRRDVCLEERSAV